MTRASNSPLDSIWERILGWLPAWLGFALIILAGIAAIVVGIIGTARIAGFIAFGVAAIASSILAWWSGAKAEPKIDPFKLSFGGVVTRVEDRVWFIVFGLFVVAGLIAIFVP